MSKKLIQALGLVFCCNGLNDTAVAGLITCGSITKICNNYDCNSVMLVAQPPRIWQTKPEELKKACEPRFPNESKEEICKRLPEIFKGKDCL